MKTILIVEDSPDISDNLSDLLILANYKVQTAKNGKEGIEKALEFVPDLIITDVMMPILDGYGLLHVIRRNPKTENIPIIFLTSKAEKSDFRNAMQMGADDYITKPFDGDDVLKAIETRLKRSELLKKNTGVGIQGITELMAAVNEDGENLESLFDGGNSISYQKKQVIYKDGAMPHYLYYIVKGKVRTYKLHNDGKQFVMGLYNEGDFFGQVALLEEAVYKETAETMEPTELLLIPRKNFELLVNKSVRVANKMIKVLAKNITEQEETLLGIAYNNLRKKVANALTTLEKKYHNNKKEPFYIDITREELAAIAGTAKESLIRALSEFKEEKLIDIRKDNKIEIINSKKLANLLY